MYREDIFGPPMNLMANQADPNTVSQVHTLPVSTIQANGHGLPQQQQQPGQQPMLQPAPVQPIGMQPIPQPIPQPHSVQPQGIQPDPIKLVSVQAPPQPATIDQIKQNCPGAPPDFVLQMAEAGVTTAQAQQAFIQHQQRQLAMMNQTVGVPQYAPQQFAQPPMVQPTQAVPVAGQPMQPVPMVQPTQAVPMQPAPIAPGPAPVQYAPQPPQYVSQQGVTMQQPVVAGQPIMIPGNDPSAISGFAIDGTTARTQWDQLIARERQVLQSAGHPQHDIPRQASLNVQLANEELYAAAFNA